MQASRAGAAETNDSPTVTRPRVQLSDLPAELKDKIAQQCHAADVRLKEYINDMTRRAPDSPPTVASLQSIRASHGRSISALYAVSKEWKATCTPYRFEVISAPKAGKAFFILVIAPLYGRHFIKADLDSLASRWIVEVVKALPMLPNLRSFTLHGFSLRTLRVDGDPEGTNLVFASLSKAIWCSARELVLVKPSFEEILHFTRPATLLSKLELQIDNEGVVNSLWQILETTPRLTHLHMDLVAFGPRDGPLDLKTLVDTKPTSIVPLSHITLESAEMLPNTRSFIGLFAPSLRTVTMRYHPAEEPAGAEPSDLPDCILPELQALSLCGPADWLLPTLSGVTPTLLPQLRTLVVDCRPAEPEWTSESSSIVSRVQAIAAEHDNLDNVKLAHPYARLDCRFGQADDSAPSRHRTEMLNLPSAYPLLTWEEPEFLVQYYSREDELVEQQRTLDYVDNLLEAGMQWRTRAVLTGDRVGLTRLAGAVQPLAYQRMLHEM